MSFWGGGAISPLSMGSPPSPSVCPCARGLWVCDGPQLGDVYPDLLPAVFFLLHGGFRSGSTTKSDLLECNLMLQNGYVFFSGYLLLSSLFFGGECLLMGSHSPINLYSITSAPPGFLWVQLGLPFNPSAGICIEWYTFNCSHSHNVELTYTVYCVLSYTCLLSNFPIFNMKVH